MFPVYGLVWIEFRGTIRREQILVLRLHEGSWSPQPSPATFPREYFPCVSTLIHVLNLNMLL